MPIPIETEVKLIDVAKDVADRNAPKKIATDNIVTSRKKTEEWTEIFDKAYKAIKATVAEEEEKP